MTPPPVVEAPQAPAAVQNFVIPRLVGLDLVKAQGLLLDASNAGPYLNIQMVDSTGNYDPPVDDGYKWMVCRQNLRPGMVVNPLADNAPQLLLLVEHQGAGC